MTFLRSVRTSKKSIATGIALSFLLQAEVQAIDCLRSMRSSYDVEQCQCREQCLCIDYDQPNKGCPCNKPRPPRSELNARGCPCNKPRPPRSMKTAKGCPCNKPKPRSVSEIVEALVSEAVDAGCSGNLPTTVRTCYYRAQDDTLSPNDVMSAMPTLLNYALEQMSPASSIQPEDAQQQVETLLSYVEEHAATLRNHPAHQKVADMLDEATQMLEGYVPLAQQMHRVAKKMKETPQPTIRGCCGIPYDSIPFDPTSGPISEPGNYYIVTDATADIIITSGSVSLDLNERIINGIVLIDAADVTVKNGKIKPQAPVSNVEAALPAVAVTANGNNTVLCCLSIDCADSIGRDITQTSSIGTALAGRGGIYNSGIQTSIADCSIIAGSGADGDMIETTTPFDIGGNGGYGILSNGPSAKIANCSIKTGCGGAGSPTCVGGQTARTGGNGGVGIELDQASDGALCSTQCGCSILNCKIATGNGGLGGTSCCDSGANGGNAGDGIANYQTLAQIRDCTICTGSGGNGGDGVAGPYYGGSGGNGGDGIYTNGTEITGCFISTGSGGNGGEAGNPTMGTAGASSGGNGGRGIAVDVDGCNTKIVENVINSTGMGGIGGNSLTLTTAGYNGNGGSGGDGIWIDASAQDTQARFNTISNTGKGGVAGSTVGATAGVVGDNGRAVTDNNVDMLSEDPACPANDARSVIYSNFAYAISNTNIRYLLHGVSTEGGVSVTASPSYFDNVYADGY